MTRWYMLSGKENDVAISSRVSLARNLRGYAFTNRLTSEEKEAIAEKVRTAIDAELPGKFIATRMGDLSRDAAISFPTTWKQSRQPKYSQTRVLW